MAWVPMAMQVGGSLIGGLMGSKGGGGYGGGMDFFNKVARKPMEDTLGMAKDVYEAGKAGNALMDQGFLNAQNLQQNLNPYMNYGNQMLGIGTAAGAGALGAGMGLLGFNPMAYNAQFQAGGAYGPQYQQGLYNQIMGNAQGAINPMLQSIANMNARMFNEQALPGMAAQAIGSGNTANTKWGLNNAVLARGVADANAQAAAGLYGNAFQQANQTAGQYGLEQANAINQMMRLNTQLGNQLSFQQAGQNAELGLRALGAGGDLFGNLMAQTNPYWSGMINSITGLPQLQASLGLAQRNAPMDWLEGYQGLINTVGTAGAPTGGMAGGGNNMAAIGQGIQAGAQFGGMLGDLWGKTPWGGG